jgi:hypothetical protein
MYQILLYRDGINFSMGELRRRFPMNLGIEQLEGSRDATRLK